jgi:hypothetical protein
MNIKRYLSVFLSVFALSALFLGACAPAVPVAQPSDPVAVVTAFYEAYLRHI